MVIELPPLFLDPVEDVGVVVAILRQTIVDNDGVQVVWSLFMLDVGLFEGLLNLADFRGNVRDLRLGSATYLS